MRALRHLRRQNLRATTGQQDVEVESDEILRQVYERLGGRTSYLAKVARADDMIGEFRLEKAFCFASQADGSEEAENMIEMEKGWLLSK
jgi:hypothetical protein